ncbi:tight adherence protein B [Litorivivens lipolytica]|uniref:Tight adherence protein B n=1 Tax=Litorivivens lipolytica TaxID=1524264 RepID=A0A7W4W3E3_9GAMM|nr:type II secretion system F family protein [Litorivivens lipolytica]MBB3046731.1 tight adherence protein B [Litorivivens lipolytica]
MIWILISLLIAAAGAVLLLAGKKEERPAAAGKKEDEDFDPLASKRSRWIPEFIVNYLNRLGLNLQPSTIMVLMVGELVLVALLWLMLEFSVALLAALGLLLITHVGLQALGNHQKQKLLQSLPSFLNQVSRRLSAGVSVEHAFTDSMENIEGPLELSMRRVMQRVGLGLELHQAFEREARANGSKELLIVSTALHINEQFGGSIRAILDDIVHILRLDDLGKRELKAQTGETRITALVLTLLPLSMITLLTSMNPDFILQMWHDSLGKNLLIIAASLQVLGAVSLWRMVRAI